MPTCKECGKPIKGAGTTGFCLSCAKKIKNMERKGNKHCIICGNPITDFNKSGICKSCWHSKGGNTNVPGQRKRAKIKCWNNHCNKMFYPKPGQHPKYSLCPACKAAKEKMYSNGRWVNDTSFSNAAE